MHMRTYIKKKTLQEINILVMIKGFSKMIILVPSINSE